MAKILHEKPSQPSNSSNLQGGACRRRIRSVICFRAFFVASVLATVAFLSITVDRPSQDEKAPRESKNNALLLNNLTDGGVITRDERLQLKTSMDTASNDGGPLFHIVFTTDEETFTTLNMRCIESIFYFHPTARLKIHSNAEKGLKHIPTRLQPLVEKGYHLEIVPYSAADVLQAAVDMKDSRVNDTAAQQWASNLEAWKTEPYWFSNESNLLRLCLLYTIGGIYLDTDVVLVRPLVVDSSENATAAGAGLEIDNAMARNGKAAFHCAVMKFLQPGNPFLAAAIDNFLQNYNGNDWGNNGPRVFKRTAKAHPELVCPYSDNSKELPSAVVQAQVERQAHDHADSDTNQRPLCRMQPLPSESFAPIKWEQWYQYCFSDDSPVKGQVEKVVHEDSGVFAVHFNNHVTGEAIKAKAYKEDSLCDLVLNTYCIICD